VIAMSLAQVAEVVGGSIHGEPATAEVVVTGPVVIDGREAEQGSLFAAFVGERVDGHDHVDQAAAAGAVAVLGSRATGLPTVVVEDVRSALQLLASYVVGRVRAAGDLTVLALTGSQGKTSTKDLLAAVLGGAAATVATRGSFNNELGMPLTALRVQDDTRFLVLEMGARGRGHIAELCALVRPDVSVVLNVGQAHLGEFGSREAIAEAKGELVEALAADGTAVLNAGDERVAAMAARTAARVLTFGDVPGSEVRVEGLVLDRLGRPSFRLVTADASADVTLRLVGAHQALNAAAATAAALAAGLDLADVATSLAQVETLSQWRMDLRELDRGVVVLNDSYNANPDSVGAALEALVAIGTGGADGATTRTVAVLGEMRELGDAHDEEHRGVGARAVELGVDRVVVVGEAARGIHEGAGDRSVLLPDNAAAVAWLAEHVTEGDVVLIKASRGARLDEVAATLK
jgi:UDP-N-acetylmuramoyl-tripeptide--D-alanyl-D-alanine ligase